MDVVGDVARTIGAADLRSIQYTGSGTFYVLGQSVNPDAPWPRFNLPTYTALIDYENSAMREEYVRTQYEDPPRGGGNQPIFGERRQVNFVNGNQAWTENPDGSLAPAPITVADRQAQIWLSPHGWVKAALAERPTMETRTEDGRELTLVSFTVHGVYKVNGYVNDQSLLERVETWLPNPAFGDMLVEATYSDYKQFDGIQFPTRIQVRQAGHPTLDLTVSEAQPNAPADITVPEAIQQAATGMRVDSQQVADGVWFVAGGSHNSVAVEFSDYVAVVEAPLGEARSLAVIEEIVGLMPGKPIRFLVNTHQHFDHIGGLRTYLHIGATIITHAKNYDFYNRDVLNYTPRTLMPDMVSLWPPTELTEGYNLETVRENYALTDGTRTMKIHYVQPLQHVEGMLMAYLPNEKILIEADLFDTHAGRAAGPSAATRSLVNQVRALKLDVQQVVPIHGRPAPWSDVLAAGQR
jgi:glyoxylase-like metal-dependent hydrolase (beta-lactamase superfamily II)